MKHFASPRFWKAYEGLPENVRKRADKSFALLKSDPHLPSLNFKPVGRYWSVRIGLGYRALAIQGEEGFHWFWIGSHADYNAMIG
jgi:hypothetical protein